MRSALMARASLSIRGVVMALCAMALCAMAVAGRWAIPGAPGYGGSQAHMTGEAEVTGHNLRVSGETDLPDGTLLVVQARDDIDQSATDENVTVQGQATVVGGAFQLVFDIARWSPGPGEATIGLVVDGSQPQALQSRFGRTGQSLAGPDVHRGDDGYNVQVILVNFAVP